MAHRPSPRALPYLVALLLLAGCSDASPTPGISASQSAAATASTEPTVEPPLSPYVGLWEDATAETIGETGDWSNKVEVADLDGNGLPDLLFANGGDYEFPGEPEASRVFLNRGAGQPFEDATGAVFGDLKALARVIRVRDFNGDSIPDIVMGTTYQTQSQLFLGTGNGAFMLATERLPESQLSVGDIEAGDVDGDGDLDLLLADWGPGNPLSNAGSLMRLWLNDGSARFTDATAAGMPSTIVRFSWDMELVDIDNDWDLDLAVSAKISGTSFLYENDGNGHFIDVTSDRMPHFTNNYAFTTMDLDGDGFMDLVTINDGDDLTGTGGGEHVFRNDGTGGYLDATPDWWQGRDNPGEDDNMVVFLDVESDGDADFIVAALTGQDRLMINDGTGRLTLMKGAFDAPNSAGTLWMAVADLNGDGRPDVVEAQGENPSAIDERVYFGTERLARDSAPPLIRTDLLTDSFGIVTVHARVTDGTSPFVAGHYANVEVRWDGSGANSAPMAWYGEYLFRATLTVPDGATGLRVCAQDRYGNEACTSTS